MNVNEICVVNGQSILAFDGPVAMVPIKPICVALNLNHKAQYDKIKEHEILKHELRLCYNRSRDGKMYKMLSLPEYYILGWLISINPKNVKKDAADVVSQNQKKCFEKLVEYFKMKRNAKN